MTQDEIHQRPPARTRRRLWPWLLGAAPLAVLGVAAGVYAARRLIAREVLVAWLRTHGVEAHIDFSRLDADGLAGQVRIGGPGQAEISIDEAQVDYTLHGFWDGRPLSADVRALRLKRPVVRMALRDGKVSFGSIDSLIEALGKTPPRPGAPQPVISVDDGVLQLDTPYGLGQARFDARMSQGRLTRLDAQISPARIGARQFAADLGEGRLTLTAAAGRMTVQASGTVNQVSTAGPAPFELRRGRYEATLHAPYPDLAKRRADGAVDAVLKIAAEQAGQGAQAVRGAQMQGRYDGVLAGPLGELVLTGGGAAAAMAQGAAFTGGRVGPVRLAGGVPQSRWSQTDGQFAAAFKLGVQAGALQLDAAQVTAARSAADLTGDVSSGPGRGLRLSTAGAVRSRAAWRGLGPVLRDDAAELAAVKRAAADFDLTVPAFALKADDRGAVVRLTAPARLQSASGLRAQAAALGGRPVFDTARQAGAAALTLRGGGLPAVDLRADRYALAGGGLTLAGQARLRGPLGPVPDADLTAAGVMTAANGAVAFTPSRCVHFATPRYVLGENELRDISGDLCGRGGALLSVSDGVWRVNGDLRDVAGAVPLFEVKARTGNGRLSLSGRGAAMDGGVRLDSALIDDAAKLRRFETIRLSGDARVGGDDISGTLAVATPSGQALGGGQFKHDLPSGRGALRYDSGERQFTPSLQPQTLTPLASQWVKEATGKLRFTAAFDWSPEAVASSGVAVIDGLDLRASAGTVQGLRGRIVFDSLAPVTTPAGQTLTADKIAAFTPLDRPTATFKLNADSVEVEAASVGVADGRLSISDAVVPLTPQGGWRGVVDVEGVQLAPLVKASPFADALDLQARVSGRLPLTADAQGVRIKQGRLAAVEPGRLSIYRKAIGGEDAAAPVDPFTGIAYQAMEDLAFDRLDAAVDSQANGRLGVRFSIKGRHEPKRKKPALTLWELLKARFGGQPLDLPSGTPIDLTLDTSLNLDQLLKDYIDRAKPDGSDAVQPQPSIPSS